MAAAHRHTTIGIEQTGTADEVTVLAPTGMAVGDFVSLQLGASRFATDGAAVTVISVPDGFEVADSRAFTLVSGAVNTRGAVYTKKVDADDVARGSFTIQVSAVSFMTLIASAVSGTHATAPFDPLQDIVFQYVTGTNTMTASLTTRFANCVLLAHAFHDNGNGSAATFASTSFTEHLDTSSVYTGSTLQAAQGDSGTKTVTAGTSGSGGIWILSLRPAPDAQDITPTGVASAEAFGDATVTTGEVEVTPTGIASLEAFGASAVSVGAVDLAPTGIDSAEAFGTAAITIGAASIAPSGVASAEAFGDATVSAGAVDLAPTGIDSAEAFGDATVSAGAVDLAPTGIDSAEAFGTAALSTGAVNVAPTGIGSAEAFGTAIVSAGGTIVLPGSIASAEAFGTPSISVGAVSVAPSGIASTEAFGTASVAAPAGVVPTGIASTEAFGTASVAPGAVSLAPSGIASAEAFGTPIAGGSAVAPSGIASAEAFGTPSITALYDSGYYIDGATEKAIATPYGCLTIYPNESGQFFTIEGP